MADLTASSTLPSVSFLYDDGMTVVSHVRLSSPSGGRLDFDIWGVGSWVNKAILDADSFTLTGPTPTLVFEDTSSSEADFELQADGGTLSVDRDGSDLLDLGVDSSGHTRVTWHGSTADVHLDNAAGTLKVVRDSTEKLAVGDSETVSNQGLRVKSSVPVLTLEDTDASAPDYFLEGNSALSPPRCRLGVVSGPALLDVALYTGGSYNRTEFWFNDYNSVTQIRNITYSDAYTSGKYDAEVEVGTGQNVRGVVHALRDQTAGNTRMGVLVLQSKNGTNWFLWVTDSGQLRVDSTDPSTNEGAGSPV